MSSTKKVVSNEAQKLEKKPIGKQTCLLILGMHRSGTSALTRTLSLMGATLPKDVMGVSKGNDTGHWESNCITIYNDELLLELESDWQDWAQLDFSHLSIKRMNEVTKEFSDIIHTEYGGASLIVLKDPRICRFTGFFLQMLVDANIRPICIHAFRNPLEVAQSLNKRNEMPLGQGLLLWLRHVLEAEKASRDYTRVFNSYSELLEDWRQIGKKLDLTHHVKFPYTTDEVSPQIGAFLKPGLKNNVATLEDLALNPLTSDWISRTYEALLVLSQNPDCKTAMGTLDDVLEGFNAVAPIIQYAFADLKQACSVSLQKANTKKDEVLARLAEQEAEMERLRQEAEVERLRQEAEMERLRQERGGTPAPRS